MTEEVSKGVILASGSGTRSRPLTYYIPKPMMPLGDTPMVKSVAYQMIASGVREILVVSRNDPAGRDTFWQVPDYFSGGNVAKNMPEYRKQIENGKIKFSVDFQGVDEKTLKPLGTAAGLKVAYDHGFLNDEPSVVMFSDVILRDRNDGKHLLLRDMLSSYNGNTLVSIRTADPKTISSKSAAYGTNIGGNVYQLSKVVEKPTAEEVRKNPTDLSVGGGIYIVNGDAQDKIGKVGRGAGGEYHITDLIDMQARDGQALGYMIDNAVFKHYDVGEFNVFIRENLEKAYRKGFFDYVSESDPAVKAILIGGVALYGRPRDLDELLSRI